MNDTLVNKYQWLFDLLKDYNFIEFAEDNFYDIDELLPENMTYDSGATKVVILDKKGGEYVVKIPFKGSYEPHEEWDDEWEEYTETGEYDFIPFSGADDNNTGWDYCMAESCLYDMAFEEGIDKVFAETQLLGYVNKHPLYVQKKCKIFNTISEKYNQTVTPADKERIEKIVADCGYTHFINRVWLSDCMKKFGEEFVKKMILFFKKYAINDVHDGNIGYTEGGDPVLIDYGGFHET